VENAPAEELQSSSESDWEFDVFDTNAPQLVSLGKSDRY